MKPKKGSKILPENKGKRSLYLPHPSDKYRKEYDMRQEAKDIGAYQAHELFGESGYVGDK